MTRSPESAEKLRAVGTEASVCDVFDRAGLRRTVAAARPEVVVSQLTAIPPSLHPRRVRRQMAATNRLRTEGTELLLEAARAAGAGRAVVQSVAFVYRPQGTRSAREDEPLYSDCPVSFREMVSAVVTTERLALSAGMEGVVLRYGYFYGPGTIYASDGDFAAAVRRRQVPIVAGGRGAFSFVHVDDAAWATRLAVESAEQGIFNVVDDEPAAVAEWLPHYAQTIGASHPLRVPRWLGRLAAGSYGVYLMCDQRGAANRRARLRLGWRPFHASWRTGFASELSHLASAGARF